MFDMCEEQLVVSDALVKTNLPAHIAGLLDPTAYPHPVGDVELVQTHISYVLMAGDVVYKIKKPLNLGFLNFTTLKRRHFYCNEEVRLNRRLCDDTYRGVVPVTQHGGTYRVGGSGTVVDYAVQMRRLPHDLMMDHLLSEDRVDAAMVERLADKIADFHHESETGARIDRFGSSRTIEQNWVENLDQVRPFIGVTLTDWQVAFVEATISAFLVRYQSVLEERVQSGRIRDCHGDLRASAVCFTDDICVYDCIEFNRRFRYSDVASEVAFLAMDLDRRGRPDLAECFVRRYQRVTGDDEMDRVLDFYKCYRAFVRGKVNSFQLDEPEIPTEAKNTARSSARHYFDLACQYASKFQIPSLVVMTGLSGTGKSTVAQGIASARDMTVVSSDAVRKQLAGLSEGTHRRDEYGGGIYSADFSRRTYSTMFERASALLTEGQSVVLDATFQQRKQRQDAFDLARRVGALAFVVETVADRSVVKQRLAAREQDETAISDATWETYLIQAERFEPVTDVDDWQHVRVDAGRPGFEVVASAVDDLARRLLPDALSSNETQQP